VAKRCVLEQKLLDSLFIHFNSDSKAHKQQTEAMKYKKAVLPQGNRAMPQVFFSVEVRQQHSLQV